MDVLQPSRVKLLPLERVLAAVQALLQGLINECLGVSLEGRGEMTQRRVTRLVVKGTLPGWQKQR